MTSLREAREQAGYGRSKFARLAGFGEGDIYRYETGKKQPRFETAMRLAAALNIGIEEIDEFAPALEEAEARRVEVFMHDLRESIRDGNRAVFVAIGDVPGTLRGELEKFALENPECVRRLGTDTETMNVNEEAR